MILGEVTVLAHAVRVLRPIVVRTRIRQLLPPICMIAVLAHAFGVEDAVDVRALSDLAARAPLLLGAFGLLRLTRDTRLTSLFAFGFRLFYSDAGLLLIFAVQHDQRGLSIARLLAPLLTLEFFVLNSHDLVITVSGSPLQRRLQGRVGRLAQASHEHLRDRAHFESYFGGLSGHGDVAVAAGATRGPERASLVLTRGGES